jgi:hypothetical protein
MAAKFLVKRSSVSGQAPNTSQLTTGELALNLTDGIMYGSNGTVVFEIGANVSSLTVNDYSFPAADGANGQVLKTDGNGNITFSTPVEGFTTGDVDTHLNQSSATSNQVLSWDGSDYSWVNQSGGSVTITEFLYKPTSNTSVFSGTDENGLVLAYSSGEEDVYLNGIKLIAGDDYAATNSTAVTLQANAVNGDTVQIVKVSGSSTVLEYQYTVSANQTIFTGSDDNSAVLNYTPGREQVFLNGVKLINGDDYSRPNTSHIILTANAVATDTLEAVVFAGAGGDLTEAVGYASSNTDLLTINTFNKTVYRTAKYIIQANTSDSYAASEALVIHDGTTAYVTEYGTLYSNNNLYTVSGDISSNDVRLNVTPTGSGTTFKVKRIAIKV